MNGHAGDVPIIGQHAHIVIDDVRVITPNQIEAHANGLGCGNSVAHLRIIHPTRARMWLIPLTGPQVEHLRDALASLLDETE